MTDRAGTLARQQHFLRVRAPGGNRQGLDGRARPLASRTAASSPAPAGVGDQVVKDRLYPGLRASVRRRSCQPARYGLAGQIFGFAPSQTRRPARRQSPLVPEQSQSRLRAHESLQLRSTSTWPGRSRDSTASRWSWTACAGIVPGLLAWRGWSTLRLVLDRLRRNGG